MPVRLHHAPPPEPAAPSADSGEPAPARPSAGSPPATPTQPQPLRAPAVDLKPRIPFPVERRRARLLRVVAALAVTLAAVWLVRSLWPRTVRVEARLVLSEQPVEAPFAGVLVRSSAEGDKVEAGAAVAELAAVTGGEADSARAKAALARAEKALSSALANQVEVERAFQAQRATRSERDEAFRLAKARQAERDRLKTELVESGPAGEPVALTAPVAGWVVSPLPAGARVEAAARLLEVLPRHGRAEAPWSGRAPKPGSRAAVLLGKERWPATVVESPAGTIAVELDLPARPAAVGPVSVELW